MSDMLSQEEIDALLGGSDTSNKSNNTVDFTMEEKDAIGEIGNISMGTAATTLSTLLGQKVTITTPRVQVLTIEELSKKYPLPYVAVDVKYKEGLEGTNLLILKEDDVSIITDLMMGGNGEVGAVELTELHLSAIGEAMNQMVGSSATSLSEIFSKKIDISPPDAFLLNLATDNLLELFKDNSQSLVQISFRMVIGELIDSEIMQLMPINFAKEIIGGLFDNMAKGQEDKTVNDRNNTVPSNVKPAQKDTMHPREMSYDTPNYDHRANFSNEAAATRNEPVNIRPVQFQAFDDDSVKGVMPENISLIQDVPLKITVELGRTVKKISEILEFGPGTIIELDKLVGEPLDILVNGQYVANGEVVVIDENYGIRVTDIVNPAKRLSKTY
ncbi:flagellar motor switch phosphatase FliY [Alkaliphilus oremlandii]|uniref:CheC, inhibitor of MCP methylation / FliN fusion protein n=1 Tax=Alkaliphilus oremlandii (strain OhILAs) TaxID=350688 RepID=A8MHF0_ALKOO|nr:flagellar motor switch phosphatase FliY [Alkaliphilus oremlandii]ABW19037.1 CheC, inhibitor of MCP methylation / FliN fusion protein [Alkaliphilus oremlandii OhILAs]